MQLLTEITVSCANTFVALNEKSCEEDEIPLAI
jgi:hypothetical protein